MLVSMSPMSCVALFLLTGFWAGEHPSSVVLGSGALDLEAPPIERPTDGKQDESGAIDDERLEAFLKNNEKQLAYRSESAAGTPDMECVCVCVFGHFCGDFYGFLDCRLPSWGQTTWPCYFGFRIGKQQMPSLSRQICWKPPGPP